MTSFRFIHSSDLHLGRPFANIPEPPDTNLRGRLMEARHTAITRLADAAGATGARHVLLAGDTFHAANPSPQIVRQALGAMADAAEIDWWILPGNHDNLRDAEPLWESILRDAPDRVHVLMMPAPVEISEGVSLLPAPVTHRSTGRDLSEALVAMPSPEGTVRLGFAHGGVTDFTESGEALPPDRDRTARLDYLALGDWHGRLAVSSRVQYPGSPEQDRFKHGRRGVCLSVCLTGPGAEPQVDEIETGQFLWTEQTLPVQTGADIARSLTDILPEQRRRDTLLRIRAQGRAALSEQRDLARAARAAAPDFAHFEINTDALATTYDVEDLDRIDRAGALRMAADALRLEAEDQALSADEQSVARAALARLYAYVQEDSEA